MSDLHLKFLEYVVGCNGENVTGWCVFNIGNVYVCSGCSVFGAEWCQQAGGLNSPTTKVGSVYLSFCIILCCISLLICWIPECFVFFLQKHKQVLLGCMPWVLVSFVSLTYGCSTSDRQICERSDLISKSLFGADIV